MSGGAFEYQQYRIEDIADEIEKRLEDMAKPRPPQKTVHCVSVYKQIGEGHFRHEDWAFRCGTIEEAKHRLRTHITEEDGHIYDLFDTWEDEDGNEHRCEYLITVSDYEDYVGGYEDTCYYGPEYSKKTIAKFRKAVKVLREACVYAQRIDLLISGDDSEDNFHKRLKEDLDKLKRQDK